MKRRQFVKNSSLATLSTLVGAQIVYGNHMPEHYIPLALEDEFPTWKSAELLVLNNKPWNVETPVHLLDDDVTPVEKMFVRNNGTTPTDTIDSKQWTLTIDGESVNSTKSFTLEQLKNQFKPYTYQLVLECGGNGRSGFFPQTSGNQWEQGAVSCAEWTGVRLKDILNNVGLKSDAVYIGYYGKDIHPSGDPSKVVISRGVPIAKALENETLLAWAVNGKDIPLIHGFPLRLVVGGYPASVSGKWVHRISVRNKVHDGAKMDGHSYKIPRHPIQPGEKLAETEENFKIIENMPVKSIITYPKIGAMVSLDKPLPIRGKAWSGFGEVVEVSYSIDFGTTWHKAQLEKPRNRWAWQKWEAKIQLPTLGYYEVWAKATDSTGKTQPMVVPAWNPGGYLNNSCFRIAVKAI
ncbi:MAG: sulfite oxidase [Spirosomataceae bacterium]